MAGKIQVNYNDVYTRTAEKRSRVASGLKEMENAYNQAQTGLSNLDGGTNSDLIATMKENRRKALIVAEILDKLLVFFEGSARQMETKDRSMGNVFEATKTTVRGGVGNA